MPTIDQAEEADVARAIQLSLRTNYNANANANHTLNSPSSTGVSSYLKLTNQKMNPIDLNGLFCLINF